MFKSANIRVFSACIRRGLSVGLLVAFTVMGASGAQAITEADLKSVISPESAKRLFDISDGNISGYSFKPQNPGANTPADDLQLIIPSKQGDITFKFDHMEHQELSKGCDQWDFFFKPVIGKEAVSTPLAFNYRSNGCGQKPDWALVAGPVNKGTEIKDSRVAGLSNFGDSELAKYLDDKANKEGLTDWAKDGLNPDANKSTKSGFLDRSTSDPFATAIGKVGEVVGSMNASLVKALQWAMDQGNLGDIQGLSGAWEVMRNLVNILFVLVLVAISVLTMLGVDSNKYSARATLPLLVFAVIGVNFSLLFATVLTNSAYVLAQPFANTARELITAGGAVSSTFTGVSDAGFGASVVLLLASVIMLIALIILLFFFIVRIIMLWLLAAASPVIFLAMVLPLTRGESKNLIKAWVKWVYMAPIAFIVLFIGAQVMTPVLASTPGEDSGASAILRSIFYAGVLVAAVLIPLQLGGRVMAMASSPAKKGARVGGKGGLGLAGAIPLGGGMTVGEATRTGRGFFKQRADQQETRALQRAAGMGTQLHEQLGGGGLATAVTGADDTQAHSVTEQLVDKDLKDLQARGFQVHEGLAVTSYLKESDPALKQDMYRELSAEQKGLANSYIGRRAVAKLTAQEGYWDWSDVRHFGDTGYQNLVTGDPLLQHAKRQKYSPHHTFSENDVDKLGLSLALSGMEGDSMRKIYTPTWDYLNPDSDQSKKAGGASAAFRKAFSDDGLDKRRANLNALRQNMNARHRNNAPDIKRERVAANYDHLDSEAKKAVLSGVLDSREDRFKPLNGGPQTYADAQAAQPADYVRD